MDFETAFKKPFTDVKKLLIGTLLGVVPVVNLVVSGFSLETAKLSMKGEKEMPEWNEWGNLFVKGLLSVVIGVIYMIPAIIIAGICLRPVIPSLYPWYMNTMMPSVAQKMNLAMPDMSGMMASMGNLAFGLGFAALLMVFIAYIIPSAVMHYLQGGFGNAFSFGSVLKKAFTKNYAIASFVFALYSSLLGGLLGKVPFIGPAFAGFVSGITGFTLYGEAFGNAGIKELKAVNVKAPVKAKKRK